jgi:hypothetical protein
MGLCRRRITGMECAVADDARRESGDGCARADSNIAGNLTGAGIGHGRSAQDGERLG